MPNAIEAALNRASAEQRERALNTIEEARSNIKLVSMRQVGDISSTDASSVAQQAQVIEEAKRTIPFETMKDVDSIDPPMAMPSTRSQGQSNVVELHPNVQSTIESIEQGAGNNYLRENAVDRAMERQQMDDRAQQQQQSAIER